MTTGKKRRGPISATDALAELAQDEDYQVRRAVFQRGLDDRTRKLRDAEKPIVVDLSAAGVNVNSVWDLVNSSRPYPAALPVLLCHLEKGGYPDRVMESLGRALAVRPSVVYWDQLASLYRASRNAGEEEGTAVALAASATEAHLDELVDFLSQSDRGESRIYFLRAILRVGGDRGRYIVESLKSDPVFGKEARTLLAI